jgi:hypothetical protein
VLQFCAGRSRGSRQRIYHAYPYLLLRISGHADRHQQYALGKPGVGFSHKKHVTSPCSETPALPRIDAGTECTALQD